jgi:hypothetical protein
MLASLMGIGSLASIGQAMDIQLLPLPTVADFTAPKRHRTGEKYPHSSTRQQARYARQIAAGQLRFTA